MDTFPIELPDRRRRRRHSPEFRAAVIEACRQPGVSIAAVALANGLNANMLRKWVNEADRAGRGETGCGSQIAPRAHTEPIPGFVALSLPTPAAQPDIRIEMKLAYSQRTVAGIRDRRPTSPMTADMALHLTMSWTRRNRPVSPILSSVG